ncbi:flotillin-1-like [Homarus americanus]|uniref:flotillin-1-like n=1 Tax=Homarus americanus TaxID=6706 RepID=UPI001C4758CF|nr:flotillin-1-like [Homarus americanus]
MVIPVFLTCGPNEVLVVSGLGHGKPAMLAGGRVLVFPGLQRWRRLSLNVMTIKVHSPGVYTVQGVALKVTGVAQVKISTQHPDVLAVACEHFLNKKQEEIHALITATLEGHQRGIMGTMTVEDIYKNRALFNSRVFEVASKDLYALGIHVLSYTITDLSDDHGYLKALGMAQTAQVKRDARIGEAEAKKDSEIQKSLAAETLLAAQYINKTLVAKAKRDFELQKAAYDQEVKSREAEANLAYELQSCKTKQKIQEEKMEIKIVEKKAKILVEQQEILRQEKHLDVTEKQPAEAAKYKMETLAAAQKQKTILESEATAEAMLLKGEAMAYAIKAKADAEAAKMIFKAEAWKEFGDAAILSMYLNTLPKMLNGVSTSLSNTKSIKMVSSGDSPVGAQKLTQEVINITCCVPDMVKNMTGVDILKTLSVA